jgi:hypothetical protein
MLDSGFMAGVGVALVAAVLINAALSKLAAFRSTVDVLRQLGLTQSLRMSAGLLIVIEWTCGIAYLIAPRNTALVVAIDCLFAAFAIVGARELLLRRGIKCGCFGNAFGGQLGWHQLIQLPVVVAVTTVGLHSDPRSAVDVLMLVLIIHLLVASISVIAASKPARLVRRQRISLAAPGPSWRIEE